MHAYVSVSRPSTWDGQAGHAAPSAGVHAVVCLRSKISPWWEATAEASLLAAAVAATAALATEGAGVRRRRAKP